MKYKIILLLIILLNLIGCGNTPIFTEMKTSRLKIVIKGTFETESVSNFVTMPTNANDTSTIQDDSVAEVTNSSTLTGAAGTNQDVVPTSFMIDIAEIRLGGKKISNYRQVFTIPLDDTHPFFNGEGIELVTDDPGDGNYDKVELYVRKMLFNNSKLYQIDENEFIFEKDSEEIFHEKTINGFDFNQLMVNSYWDSLRLEASEINRIFPIQIPIIGDMKYSKENGETVLEIRLVLKNFIKKYEYTYYSSGEYKVCHYYAPSDWLRDVKAGDVRPGVSDIGRNLLTVARSYVTDKFGSITVSNASGGYVVAIPATEAASNLNRYYITDTGKALRTTVGDSDLPLAPSYPGAYIEPVLDYYLKLEQYKTDWTTQVASITDLAEYTSAWDAYENAVHGDPDGDYIYGLKIPPYVGYSDAGGSVTFSNMAPGSYKFYRMDKPSNYGELFLNTDFNILNGGSTVDIVEGPNTGF